MARRDDLIYLPWRARKRRRLRALTLCLLTFCVSAGGVVVWDNWNVGAMPSDLARVTSTTCKPNSVESEGVVVQLSRENQDNTAALRELAERGDKQAAAALALLAHDQAQPGSPDALLAQIKGRLIVMSDQDFLAWLRATLK